MLVAGIMQLEHIGQKQMSNIVPTGHFSKFLCMDSETSGVAFDSADPTHNSNTGETYQSISWGLVVVDSVTLTPIDKLYVEIKWNGVSTWSSQAEQIHGLSKQHLDQHGMDEQDAACEIASFILDHFDSNTSVNVAGHNVATFDMAFMRQLLSKYGIMFKCSHRFIDTNSIGFAAFDTYTSDQLFELVGIERKQHNSLEDAMAVVRVLRVTRQLYNTILGD